MQAFLVGWVATLVVIAVVAFWSDRRDRRAGIDPRARADQILERRRKLREERTNRTVRRYLGPDDAPRGRRAQ